MNETMNNKRAISIEIETENGIDKYSINHTEMTYIELLGYIDMAKDTIINAVNHREKSTKE